MNCLISFLNLLGAEISAMKFPTTCQVTNVIFFFFRKINIFGNF